MAQNCRLKERKWRMVADCTGRQLSHLEPHAFDRCDVTCVYFRRDACVFKVSLNKGEVKPPLLRFATPACMVVVTYVPFIYVYTFHSSPSSGYASPFSSHQAKKMTFDPDGWALKVRDFASRKTTRHASPVQLMDKKLFLWLLGFYLSCVFFKDNNNTVLHSRGVVSTLNIK